MKKVNLLLVVLLICSCVNHKEKTENLIVSAVNDITAKVPDNTDETIAPFYEWFQEETGTYFGLNDLSYFLWDSSITSISLCYGTFSDLTPLTKLPNLEELSIMENWYLTDISPLSSLVNLKSLYLFISPGRNYAELLPLKHLESLGLAYVHDVTNIAQLQSLKTLQIGGFERSGEELNINRLENLVNLEDLTLDRIQALDLSWIQSLRKLKVLWLRDDTINDITPLAALPNLEKIYIASCTIEDITPLLKSKSIKQIRVDNGRGNVGMDDLPERFNAQGIHYECYFGDM
jgi:Leucine-rich repeat (LRR) protein